MMPVIMIAMIVTREGGMGDPSDNDSNDSDQGAPDLAVSQIGCCAQYPAPAPRMSSGSSLSAPSGRAQYHREHGGRREEE